MEGKLILTSYGIHTMVGYSLIAENFSQKEAQQKRILLISLPEFELGEKLTFWCQALGFARQNITVFCEEEVTAIKSQFYDVIYVSEGNTFDMLQYIRDNGLIPFVQDCVKQGADYIGASAGAYIAGKSIKAALRFEDDRTDLTSYAALGLFDGVAIPHYDVDTQSRYLAYKAAKESGKYKHIKTIDNDEVVVISTGYENKRLEERSKNKTVEDAEKAVQDTGKAVKGTKKTVKDEKKKVAEAKRREKAIALGREVAEYLVKGYTKQTFEVEIETGETKIARVNGTGIYKDKEFVVYTIENEAGRPDILASYLFQDEDGDDVLGDIENPEDEQAIIRFVMDGYKTGKKHTEQ